MADRADGGRVAQLWGDREHLFGGVASIATLWRLCDERIDATRLRGIGAARVPAWHAKLWLVVLTEIKNRGTTDVCIVVCDGLKGLPEAVTTVGDRAVIQTCVIHLLRNIFALPPASTGIRSSGISVRSVPRPPKAAAKETLRRIHRHMGCSVSGHDPVVGERLERIRAVPRLRRLSQNEFRVRTWLARVGRVLSDRGRHTKPQWRGVSS